MRRFLKEFADSWLPKGFHPNGIHPKTMGCYMILAYSTQIGHETEMGLKRSDYHRLMSFWYPAQLVLFS